MKRFAGQPLPNEPRLAVVANDAIGNFVVATPLLQMLRARYRPSRLDLYCGTRARELGAASDLIDGFIPLHGAEPRESLCPSEPPYDLVLNMEMTPLAKVATAVLAGPEGLLCGPAIGEGGRADMPFPDDPQGRLWADREWIAEDLRTRYPFLTSAFIGEIFCRLAYLEGPVPPYRLPMAMPQPHGCDVLIAASASLPEKLWPLEKWRALLQGLAAQGRTAGLLGAAPKAQGKYWKGSDLEGALVEEGLVRDLRGRFSLPEVVGAISAARLVITLDNGIMHLACATLTPAVALFRWGIHRLWAPPAPNLTVLTAGPDAQVDAIAPERVLDAASESLAR